jgi:hypothetical protein
MEIINIQPEHLQFIEKYAPQQDIGGFSNLATADLSKATRLDYQLTGIAGELAWYLYRYHSLEKLGKLLDFKFETLRPTRKGDDGYDDKITHNSKTRLVDIKTSHVVDEKKIPRLNLVIPEREFHKDMIYVCAFSVGKTRREIEKVILAGWCANEHVTKRWAYDPNKYCVPVEDLRNLDILKKIL